MPGVVLLLSLALSVGALEGQAFAEPPPDDDVAAMVDVPATDPVDGADQSLSGYARQYAIDAAQDDTDPPDGSTAIPAAGPDGTADITPEKLAAAEDGLVQIDGGVPVKIGAASDDTTQQPVGTWAVDVLSQTDTAAAGVNGLLMQVTTSDTTPAPARLQVDYTDFKNYFGAQWSDRLQLVRYPECFLTDPDNEECATPEPLDNSADLRADTTTTDTDGNETTDLGATKVEATVDLSTPMDADTATGTTTADATAALDKGSTQSAVYHGSAARAVTAAASSGAGGVLGVTDSGNGAGGSFRATPFPRRAVGTPDRPRAASRTRTPSTPRRSPRGPRRASPSRTTPRRWTARRPPPTRRPPGSARAGPTTPGTSSARTGAAARTRTATTPTTRARKRRPATCAGPPRTR